MSSRFMVAVVAGLALALGACSLSADQRIIVGEDGTADVALEAEITMPVDPATLAGDDADPIADMQESLDEVEGELAELAERIGAEDWAVLGPEDDRLRFGFELDGVPFENLETLYAAELGEDDMASTPPLESVELVDDGGQIRFSATMPAADDVFDLDDPEDDPEDDAADPPDAAEDAVGDIGDMDEFEELLDVDTSMSLTVAMPGELTDHNADRVDEPETDDGPTELSWDAGDEPREVSAESDVSAGLPLAVWGAVVAVAVVVVVAGVGLARRATA